MTEQSLSSDTLIALFLQRLTEQDAPGIAELFAEKIDWNVPGDDRLPWVGSRTRRSDISDYFQTMWPHFVPGESLAKLNKVISSGNDVVITASFSHKVAGTGRSFETPVVLHLTVSNDKFQSMHLYEDTLKVSNAFFRDTK